MNFSVFRDCQRFLGLTGSATARIADRLPYWRIDSVADWLRIFEHTPHVSSDTTNGEKRGEAYSQPESIEWFREDQAFSLSYVSAPPPPLFLHK
jgi:hypothetical protein